jgi:phosphoribosylaminoimidazole-succinocarboxamide synthase
VHFIIFLEEPAWYSKKRQGEPVAGEDYGRSSTARGCLLRYSGGWTGGRPQVVPTGVQRFWGIPTHYIEADLDKATMTVKPATVFGKGLEVICRFRAVGSFYRRYGDYVEEGQPLDAFVEVTLKDDAREDPPISEDALDMLNILSKQEYQVLKELTRKIAGIIKAELAKKDIELYDIKFEFGRIAGEIVVIDEISGGNMRAFKDGQHIQPLDLARLVLN